MNWIIYYDPLSCRVTPRVQRGFIKNYSKPRRIPSRFVHATRIDLLKCFNDILLIFKQMNFKVAFNVSGRHVCMTYNLQVLRNQNEFILIHMSCNLQFLLYVLRKYGKTIKN